MRSWRPHPVTRASPPAVPAVTLAWLLGVLALGACGPPGTLFGRNALRETSAFFVFTNDLTQPINLYVQSSTGPGEVFLGRVDPGVTDTVVVRGVPAGAVVGLRATPVSGLGRYVRVEFILEPGASWRVP